MTNQTWKDRLKEIDQDYCRYISYKLTGQMVAAPPDYMNDSQAIEGAEEMLRELGLGELYSDTLEGMSIRLQKPFPPSSLRAFAMVKMFREQGEASY